MIGGDFKKIFQDEEIVRWVIKAYSIKAFDGDILNIIGMMSEEMKYAFRKYDPVSRMIISRDSGLLNEYVTLVKGSIIDLYYFATVE